LSLELENNLENYSLPYTASKQEELEFDKLTPNNRATNMLDRM